MISAQNGGHVNGLDGDKKEKRVYKVALTGGLFKQHTEALLSSWHIVLRPCMVFQVINLVVIVI